MTEEIGSAPLQQKRSPGTDRLFSTAGVLLLCVALALRLAYFALSYSQLGSDGLWTAAYDTQHYASAASDFQNGTDNAQEYVLVWGPGYPLVLSAFLAFWENPVVALLLVQILLSSASCLVTVALGNLLVPSRPVGLVAGWLLATSYASITLASVALPDTLFFFLAALGFYLLITGLQTTRIARTLAAAFLLAAGALTKSIGAFWPVLVVAIAVPYVLQAHRLSRTALKRCVIHLAVCLSAMLSIQTALVVRNYTRFGIATVSSTVQGGIANVAAFALEGLEGSDYREIRAGWHQAYMSAHGLQELTPGQVCEADRSGVESVMRDHPLALAWAYARLAGENMVAMNELARIHFPGSQVFVISLEYALRGMGVGLWWVVLSLAGASVLLYRRAYSAVWVLLALYGYYALLVAATRWQGSRLFYPSELAATVLVGVALAAAYGWGRERFRRYAGRNGLS